MFYLKHFVSEIEEMKNGVRFETQADKLTEQDDNDHQANVPKKDTTYLYQANYRLQKIDNGPNSVGACKREQLWPLCPCMETIYIEI